MLLMKEEEGERMSAVAMQEAIVPGKAYSLILGYQARYRQKVEKGDREDMQTSNSIANAPNSIASLNSSFENVVVEQWKAKIDKHFSIEKKSLSSSSAALIIQNLYRSFRHRRTFKKIKAVLAQAEETITKKVFATG